MTEAPPFDDVLQRALAGLDDDDVRIFYAYFDELKAHARRHLRGKAGALPGDTAVAQSALLSLFCDVAVQQIPLSDVDEYGKPMLWPLLLKYVERHCAKWNKYYQAKKRKGTEVSLAAGGQSADQGGALDVADYRAAPNDEKDFVAACEALATQLSQEDQVILEGRLRNETLEQLAAKIGRSQSTVFNRLNRIRALLESR